MYLSNDRRDDLAAIPGSTVDRHNDIHLTEDGRFLTFRFDSWSECRNAIHVDIYHHIDCAIADSLMVWERVMNPGVRGAFREEEFMMMDHS
jgi:hypothetical protein